MDYSETSERLLCLNEVSEVDISHGIAMTTVRGDKEAIRIRGNMQECEDVNVLNEDVDVQTGQLPQVSDPDLLLFADIQMPPTMRIRGRPKGSETTVIGVSRSDG